MTKEILHQRQNLRQSLRKSPRKSPNAPYESTLHQGVTLSTDEKKEIMRKKRKLLKESFPKRDKPYSGFMLLGRVYEVVV